jgi:hypothetical protein
LKVVWLNEIMLQINTYSVNDLFCYFVC